LAVEAVAAEAAARGARDVRTADSPAEALEAARVATPEGGLICVTGSLFLAAEARAVLLGLPPTPVPAPVA
jgi:dihydrofolate synthase/folylpolyglutamate synthase